MDDLRAAVKTFHVADWSVPRKKTTAIPGTWLTLCWTDAGAPHPDSCDEHSLDAPTAGDFSKDAIYTIIAPARFYGAPREGLVFTEKKLWTKAAELLRQAQADNTRLVLIVADATYCSRLLGWTTVENIELGEITTVRTGALVPLRRARRDSVVKSSDGVPLSTNYIRPYVLCELPSFLEGAPKPTAATATTRARARAQPLLAFTWCYKGWVPYTKELVELTDAVEARRGFGPPLWVDIRIKRYVRAPGFREREFENFLGGDRYVWMRKLGNRAVVGDSNEDGTHNIDDPNAVNELLDAIVDSAARGRRVIFFCSCGSPHGREICHRGTVADLLLACAVARGVPVAVQEWPGGSPAIYDLGGRRADDDPTREVPHGSGADRLSDTRAFIGRSRSARRHREPVAPALPCGPRVALCDHELVGSHEQGLVAARARRMHCEAAQKHDSRSG